MIEVIATWVVVGAMILGPGAFVAAYARPFWRNRHDPIAINQMSMALCLLTLAVVSLLVMIDAVPNAIALPIAFVANFAVAAVVGWRAVQVWQLNRKP